MTNHHPNFKDITGQRFGRLIALELATEKRDGRTLWLCRCDCGKEKAISGKYLRTGRTISCGCARRGIPHNFRHGHGHARHNSERHYLYRTWSRMRERCNNPNHHAYDLYGGCGITVCTRWNDFAVFLADILGRIGERPPGLTLDRYPDPYGNYEPDNVRWATRKQQANNRRLPSR
jgi:hypothetical protein